MKKQLISTTAIAIGLALGAGATTASAATPEIPQAQAGANVALSAKPVEGKNANYRGTIVPAGGVEISTGRVAYDGGATILTIPEAGAPITTMAYDDCVSGYVCLWQDSNYNGRRLQFSSTGCHNLGDYGFNDAASSYRSRLNRFSRLRRDSNCKSDYITINSGAASSTLGSFNDEASSLGIS